VRGPILFVLAVSVLVGVLFLIFNNAKPANTMAAATASPAATAAKSAPNVIRLSARELVSDPQRYAGKRVTVKEKLMLGIQSYDDFVGSGLGLGYNRGTSPYNPRCEYLVSITSWGLPSSIAPIAIQGCVPRSKIYSLAGAWNGEMVQFIGVVSPKQDLKGYVFMRDILIIQPRENTSEKWPDER
jgi:hypothetical protein